MPLRLLSLLCLLFATTQEPLATGAAAGPSDYVVRDVRGWTVRVHAELAAEESALGVEVLELLEARLLEATRAVPTKALAELRKVELWMELDYEGVPGGVYHPSREWLVGNGHDPALARCVQFGNAKNFLSWSFSQPSMVIHELAHAYHHQVLGYDEPTVRAAYERAKGSGDYDAVLRYGGARAKAYGMNNEKEYFAELSEAYFGANDFYPFVKPELKEHDPQGFAAIESLWSR